MELVYKLIQNLLLYFVIAIGENSLKMKNNAMMLSSVYDAMKSNGGEGYRNAFYPNDLLSYDLRNKRNINEKWDVDNVVQYEEPAHAIKPERYIVTEVEEGCIVLSDSEITYRMIENEVQYLK